MSLVVNGKTIETDEENFLLNPEDWDEDVAKAIAENEGIELDEIKWGLIRYFREYYEDHMKHPSMITLIRTLGRAHGDHYEEEKEYEKFLYSIFPNGNPVVEFSKLAGLPKPRAEVEN